MRGRDWLRLVEAIGMLAACIAATVLGLLDVTGIADVTPPDWLIWFAIASVCSYECDRMLDR